jgi:anti-sigma factor RsiW
MNCKDVQAELIFFMDGELGETESREIEAHLGGCAECSVEARRLKESIRLFQSLPGLSPDRRVEAAVWERIGRGREKKARFFSFLRPRLLIPVGAVALATLLFVGPFRHYLPPMSETEEAPLNEDFLVNYPVIENLDALQDLDVIEKLPTASEGKTSGIGTSWLS